MGQANPQAILGAGQSAGDRADRPAEPVRRFGVGAILEEAEQHRQAELVREPLHFFDDGHRAFVRLGRYHPDFDGTLGNVPDPLAHPDGGVSGDPEQVARDRAAAHRTRLPGQHQEGGLEGILGRVPVARQFAPADPPDQFRVPADEQFERCGIAGVGESH